MATHTISIYATTATPYPLTISDDEGHSAATASDDENLTTGVNNGDTVIWEIAAGANISSIDAITDTSTIDVFSTAPAPTGNGTGSWSGIIGSNNSVNDIESYSISYTVNGVQYTEDPKLKINQ